MRKSFGNKSSILRGAAALLLAAAGGLSAAPLFRGASAPAAKAAAREFSARSQFVTVDWSAFSGASPEALAGAMDLNLFPDASFQARRVRAVWHGPGHFEWVGKIGDDDAIFAARGGHLYGSVQSGHRLFEIESVDGSLHRIHEVDQEAIARLEREHPDCVEGAAEEIPETPLLPGQGEPVIDVMIVYLREASSKIADMPTFLASLITLSNQAYVNSAIPQTIRLVHHQEVVSGIVGRSNLSWMRNDPGIAALRDKYGADLVSMILETHDAAGTASGNFSIVTRSAAYGNKTFPHELGHNMGANHAWEQYTNPTGYNYGYINHAKSWRTIMSYSACNNGGPCTRVNWFSNPDVRYNGDPAGIAGSRDNARMMRSRSASIAALKPTRVGPTALQPRALGPANAFSLAGISRSGAELILTQAERLEVSLHALDGSRIPVATRRYEPGRHRLTWDGERLGPGVHFLQVRSQGGSELRKVPAL